MFAEVGLAVRHHVVVAHRCGDLRARRRGPHRQPAAQAEADRPDAAAHHAGLREQVLRCAAHVGLGALHRHRHHLLFGLARLGRRLAAKQVRRQRDEARLGETVTDRADVRVETPPLLQHDRPRAPARGRRRKVSRRGAVAGRELDVGHVAAPCGGGWSMCAARPGGLLPSRELRRNGYTRATAHRPTRRSTEVDRAGARRGG